MRIGVPREIKTQEYRVGLPPEAVRSLADSGHDVFVEAGAGAGSGYDDAAYASADAQVVSQHADVFAEAELLVKVKEPLPEEFELLRPGQVLFTFLHLAAQPEAAECLVNRGVTGIAYETVQSADGALPCLRPMSDIAGRLAVQAGAKCLERPAGGPGLLLSGVPGVTPGEVLILGGGVAGAGAARLAVGLGASVTVMDINVARLEWLADLLGNRLRTVCSSRGAVEAALQRADLVIGTVLIPGARTPHLIRREDLALMKPRSVIVDVAIDQGGCAQSSHPTTHDRPTFSVDGIVHYCVANMPGAVPLTSTLALSNQTLPYLRQLADKGVAAAVADSAALRAGVNVCAGHITSLPVAEALQRPYVPLEDEMLRG